MRPQVIEPEPVHGGVRGKRVEVGCLDDRHLAPRRERGRRDVHPPPTAVVRHVNKTVVGTDPQQARFPKRRRDRVDHAPMLALLGVERSECPQVRRDDVGSAGQVGADGLPARAAVHRAKQHVGRAVQHAGVDGGKRERHGADPAVFPGAHGLGRHLLHLARAPVESAQLAAVHEVRVQRVGRDVAVFFRPDGTPFPDRDLAVVAPAHDTGRPALLLAAVHPIRKPPISRDVIELRGRLIVPRAPRRAAVHSHDRALVAREQDDPGIPRIDPHPMIVVTARGAAKRGERAAPIRGLPRDHVGDVHHVGIRRIDLDLIEVTVPAPQALVRVDEPPVFAAVVRAVQAATLAGTHDGVDPRRCAGRDGEADAAESLRRSRQPGSDLSPRRAAVRGLVEPIVRGERPGTADLPRRLPRRPQHREHSLRIRRIEAEVHAAAVVVLEQDFLPRLAAVRRAIDAPLVIRAVGMSQHRHEHTVGIARVDEDRGDLLPVPQAEMTPGAPAVRGLIDPVSYRQVGTLQAFAAAHVQGLGIRRRDGDRADRAGRLVVEDRRPGAAVVGALPHAAVVHPDVEHVGRAGDAGGSDRAAAAKRADQAPAQRGIQRGVVLLRGGPRPTNGRQEGKRQQRARHSKHRSTPC